MMSATPTPHKQVSNEIQNLLIKEYLKKHEDDLEKNDIFQCRHGKIVFEEIEKVFQSGGSAPKMQGKTALSLHDIPIQELTVDPEDRFASCQQSSKNSKRLIQTLFTASIPCISLTEKSAYENELRMNSRWIGIASSGILVTKQRIFNLIENEETKPTFDNVKTCIVDLLEHTMNMIKYQHTLLKIETDLLNRYFEYSKNYIEKHFASIKTGAKSKSLVSIAKVYKYVTEKSKISMPDMNHLDFDTFQQAMQQYQGLLSDKRNAIENLQKVINFIELLVIDLGGSKPGANGSSAKPTQPEQQASSRMSLMGRLLGRFRK